MASLVEERESSDGVSFSSTNHEGGVFPEFEGEEVPKKIQVTKAGSSCGSWTQGDATSRDWLFPEFEGTTVPFLLWFYDKDMERVFWERFLVGGQQIRAWMMNVALVVPTPIIFLIFALMPYDFPPIAFLYPTLYGLVGVLGLVLMCVPGYKKNRNWALTTISVGLGVVMTLLWQFCRIIRHDLEVDLVAFSGLTALLLAIRVRLMIGVAYAVLTPINVFVGSIVYLPTRDAVILSSPHLLFGILCLSVMHRLEWLARKTFHLQTHLSHVRSRISNTKGRSDAVLQNILPSHIIEAYKNNQTSVTRRYESCTVIFIKVLSFPVVSPEQMSKVLKEMTRVISRIESCCDRYGVEKVKTLGTTFMAVSGAPREVPNHLEQAMLFALDVVEDIKKCGHEVMIGLHSGAVVGGVIGAKIFWDIWGDTVNVSSRMCSSSMPGKIQCTSIVLKKFLASAMSWPGRDTTASSFIFVEREEPLMVKGKGLMHTCFVQRLEQLEECLPGNLGKYSPSPLGRGKNFDDTYTNRRGTQRLSVTDLKHLLIENDDTMAPLEAFCDTASESSGGLAVTSRGCLFYFATRVVNVLENAVTELFTPPDRRLDHAGGGGGGGGSPSSHLPSTEQDHWRWLFKQIRSHLKRARLDMRFQEHSLEAKFWQQAHDGAIQRTRFALILLFSQGVVLTLCNRFGSQETSSPPILIRHSLYPTVVLILFLCSFLVSECVFRQRWTVNLMLGGLFLLKCAQLAYEFSTSVVPRLDRMLHATDLFFVATWIGTYPVARFNDVAVMSVILVLVAGALCVTIPLLLTVLGLIMNLQLAASLTERESRMNFLLEREIIGEMKGLRMELQHSRRLLKCCMPLTVVTVLVDDSVKDITAASMRFYDSVVIIATDVVQFTEWSSSVAPEMVVQMLHKMVSHIDDLVDLNNAEKVKTIGDAYIAVIGLDGLGLRELEDLKNYALGLQELSRSFEAPDGTRLHIRIGIAVGQAVACIVGRRKWQWDLWGEAVLRAEKMEQTGAPDLVHISHDVHLLMQQCYFWQHLNTAPVVDLNKKDLKETPVLEDLDPGSGGKIDHVVEEDDGSYFILGRTKV